MFPVIEVHCAKLYKEQNSENQIDDGENDGMVDVPDTGDYFGVILLTEILGLLTFVILALFKLKNKKA